MRVSVVIPNWNGEQELPACLDALLAQSLTPEEIIVVDNGSTDGSKELLYGQYPQVTVIPLPFNTGFASGVNVGLRYSSSAGYDYTALLNNDAVADKNWLKSLVDIMYSNPRAGIVTSKMINDTGEYLDSTGELYTVWGLPYPRGRREANTGKYDGQKEVFGASGGASLYRHKMLAEIGFFDEDFFAYYEDVDISFRAQLAGWKVLHEPNAKVHHHIGATSGRVRGFTTYHTMKNLPWLAIKNVPKGLLHKVLPRLFLAYSLFLGRALARGQSWTALKGSGRMWWLLPKKLVQRYKIQKNRKVSPRYINSILTHDLPPDARGLRRLRSSWWTLRRKKV
ncbi:glycosyltransferase family 2 protein [Candidatus Saccharibacteria bacterium]|nr:glycosyltransferase family 2 protein [Candidatus Saccharibacteria bacterium]